MKASVFISKSWHINPNRDYKKFPWSVYKSLRLKWLKKHLPKVTKKQMKLERELADWFQLENYEERHR